MMFKKSLLVLLLIHVDFVTSSPKVGNPFHEKNTYSFILITLEKSMVQFQRYDLQDLAEDMHISDRERKSHTFFELNMGEHGLKILSVGFDEADIGRCIITAQRGRTLINYYMYWSDLFLRDDAHVVDCFGLEFNIAHDAFFKETDSAVAQYWPSIMYGQWKFDEEFVAMRLAFDKIIKSACGLLIQNNDCKQEGMFAGRLTKKEALDQGVICVISENVEREQLMHENESRVDEVSVNDGPGQAWLTSFIASIGSWLGITF